MLARMLESFNFLDIRSEIQEQSLAMNFKLLKSYWHIIWRPPLILFIFFETYCTFIIRIVYVFAVQDNQY